MKKSLICTIMCASLCLSNSYAAINIEKDNCKYTVTADCDANEKVTMLVSKKDGDLSDSNIVAIKEGTSADKKITFRFEFEESPEYEGKYTVYIMNNENKVDFIHALNTSIASAASALQSVTVSNGTEGLEELIKPGGIHRNALEAMGVKCEIYDECNNQQDIRDLFIAEKESTDDLVQLLNNSIAVVLINSGNDLDSALLCATSNFENFSYEDFDGELKKWCKELIGRDYDTTEEFIERYNEICILYKFNNSKFSEFVQLFNEYSGVLKITKEEAYKEYDKLSKTDKMKVGEELVILLDKTPVKTSAELIETLDEAYQNVKAQKNNKPSGGSQGGGSKGGGSGFNGGIVSPGTTTITPAQSGVENNSEIKYNDIQNVPWAETAINALTKSGIVSGDGNGNFRPNDTITREEFVKMLITAAGAVNEHAESSFSDLDKNAWYYKYVASAYDAGIVSGISDTEFGVGKKITRQEMAVMTARALQTIDKTTDKVEAKAEIQDEAPVIDSEPEIISGKTVPGWGELSTTADSLNDVRVGITDYDAKTGVNSLCAIFPNKNLATHNYYLTNTNVHVDLKAGQTYSVGVWYKVDSEIEEAFRAWTFFAVGSAESGVFELDTTEKETVDGWKHRYLVFTATENKSGELYFGFCPNFSHVTDRAEVKILFDDIYFCEESRYFYKDDEASGANLVYNPSFEEEIFQFSDSDEIAEWAKDAVLSLYDRGIMSGTADGKFDPCNVATRAQAAVVVYNLIK